MSLQGKILFILGLFSSFVGLVAKLWLVEQIDGASLILVGILSIIFAIGGFAVVENTRSNKQKIFDWLCLFLIVIAGVFSYLRKW